MGDVIPIRPGLGINEPAPDPQDVNRAASFYADLIVASSGPMELGDEVWAETCMAVWDECERLEVEGATILIKGVGKAAWVWINKPEGTAEALAIMKADLQGVLSNYPEYGLQSA